MYAVTNNEELGGRGRRTLKYGRIPSIWHPHDQTGNLIIKYSR
jgi:hypothetical protein